jgi:hypothetical protein
MLHLTGVIVCMWQAVAVTDNIEFGADYGEGYYVEEIDVTPR